MPKYHQGIFRPKNPHKYKGDHTNIVYRSGWELSVMVKFDNHPDILEWSSEELIIPYRSPIDGKMHRYFPDFLIKKRSASDGKISTVLIEVKPKKQTIPPRVQNSKRPSKRYINEVYTWGVNSAKWKSADSYCKDRGWSFQILTEDDIGVN